jgi:Xaa-Pro dipeptidase
MKKVEDAQKYLKEMNADGWLLYDFHKNNPLAHQFLEISSNQMTTRRFFYWIPVEGEPVKIVHAIEPYILDHLPGKKRIFSSWQTLEKEVSSALRGARKIAMEYSPRNAIPYIARVDAGTVDWVRTLGIEVVSSGEFLPHFTAVLSDSQVASHKRAAALLEEVVADTWKWIAGELKKNRKLTEYEVQQRILGDFAKRKLITDHPPIVAVNAHSADPHYAPTESYSSPIQWGDFILIDLWAKEAHSSAVFADITRVAIASEKPSKRHEEIFNIVRSAQKAAVKFLEERFAEKKRVEGWEVDEVTRNVIRSAGYGDFFIHRTGHNIEIDLHGSGAHLDNLESHDERPILPGTCFSIEPGIYLPREFGVRLEHDVFISRDGKVEVTGGIEEQLHYF